MWQLRQSLPAEPSAWRVCRVSPSWLAYAPWHVMHATFPCAFRVNWSSGSASCIEWHVTHDSFPPSKHLLSTSPFISRPLTRTMPSGQKYSDNNPGLRARNSLSPGTSPAVRGRMSGVVSPSRSPGRNRNPFCRQGSPRSIHFIEWQNPHVSVERTASSLAGCRISPAGSGASFARDASLRRAFTWRSPGPWQASHEMPSSAARVSTVRRDASTRGSIAVAWQRLQPTFQTSAE